MLRILSFEKIILLFFVFNLINCHLLEPIDIKNDGQQYNINGNWHAQSDYVSDNQSWVENYYSQLIFNNDSFQYFDTAVITTNGQLSWKYFTKTYSKSLKIEDTICFYKDNDQVYRLTLRKMTATYHRFDSSYSPSWQEPQIHERDSILVMYYNFKSNDRLQIIESDDIRKGIYNK